MKAKMKTPIAMAIMVLGAFIFSAFFNHPTQTPKKWEVPATAKKMKNPTKANADNLAVGKMLYNKHCKSCHGTKGKGDGTKAKELDTPCGDFTASAFTAQTDGEIFYKSKEGRDDMPSFKKKIPNDEDMWFIVNYIRTF